MAKPTKIQREICNALIKEICWWRDSNDIDSPTHISDMEDCIRADLEEFCTEHQIELLTYALQELYWKVKCTIGNDKRTD